MAIPFSENGGFAATNFYLFVPTIENGTPNISIFDPTSFDDPDDPSAYSWRAEDVIVGRVPVVRRVILVYTDLGLATITMTVTGVNDTNNLVSSASTIQIGTSGATGLQLTKFIDLQLAAFRPQLTASRAAGGGPVSIVSCTMLGEVEEVEL